MPKINVYLPDALASAVKGAGVPVSAVCQAALSDAVERIGRARRTITLLREGSTSGATLARLAESLQRRMTKRMATAVALASTARAGVERTSVASLDLLRGLLDDGENLAVRLLVAQGIDIDELRDLSQATAVEELGAPDTETADSLFARMTMPARSACAAALELVIELGHNYLGCEHLLIGLAASDGGAAELLRAQGVELEELRQGLKGAVAGVVFERSTSSSSDPDALANLASRIEAIERRLTDHAGA